MCVGDDPTVGGRGTVAGGGQAPPLRGGQGLMLLSSNPTMPNTSTFRKGPPDIIWSTPHLGPPLIQLILVISSERTGAFRKAPRVWVSHSSPNHTRQPEQRSHTPAPIWSLVPDPARVLTLSQPGTKGTKRKVNSLAFGRRQETNLQGKEKMNLAETRK